MKLSIAGLHTFAQASAISMQMWEALGRAAAVIPGEFECTLRDPVTLSEDTDRALHSIVCGILSGEGLRPQEWCVFFLPKLVDGVMPEEWVIHLRFRGAMLVLFSEIDSTFTPTLAEQFEKK